VVREQRAHIARTFAGLALAVLAAAAVTLEHGFHTPPLPLLSLQIIQIVAIWLALAAAGDLAPHRPSLRRWRSPLARIGEPVLAGAALAEFIGAAGAAELVAAAGLVALAVRLNGELARTIRNPSLLFPASFAALIAASTLLLKLPAATPTDNPIGWIDALFTATSAVCVTGLVVRDTAAEFTLLGQAVILVSIQLGGLGVMIFGSTLALLFGARLSFKEHVTLSTALDEYPAHRITRFVGFIVLTTLVLEAVTAAVFFASWPGDASASIADRAWHAVFHSVSAFCNAGFDVTGDSMVGLRASAAPYIAFMPAIVLGGLGFVVLEDLFRVARSRLAAARPRRRLNTHSRLVLATTAALLALGAAIIFVAQLEVAGVHPAQRFLDACFMSTTARTAGFTSMPMEELSPGSRFMLMLLMAIGGSPGSTAGGMKTAVFGLLVLAILSTVRGRQEVEGFGRSLPDALVKKAATVAVGLAGLIALTTLVLDLTERIPFEPLLFEAVSAATTTGLTLGATDELSPVGRVIITVTMFTGRVGPLALLASLMGLTRASAAYRLPRDSVSLG